MHRSAIVVLAASGALAACQARAGEGRGANVSRTYKVGDFTGIEVTGPYDVQVRTGGQPGVSATGPEKLLERTEVEVRGDRLVIHPENRRGWIRFGWTEHGKVVVTVSVPKLSSALITGSGDIHVDRAQGAQFEGTVAGSGNLGIDQVDLQSLKLTIAGSGAIKARGGKARSGNYDIGGSGDIDARGIEAQDAKISIAGSGSVRARSAGTADVSITGSGDVDIAGGAKCTVSKAGSGSVRCS